MIQAGRMATRGRFCGLGCQQSSAVAPVALSRTCLPRSPNRRPAARSSNNFSAAAANSCGVLNLDTGICFQEEAGNILEVFHERAENDGLRPVRGFENIVPSGGDQAPPHENHIGQFQYSRQFSDAVEQQDFGAASRLETSSSWDARCVRRV